MNLSRRKLIGGLGLLIAAPAVVRATSIMPVKAMPSDEELREIGDFDSLINPPLISRLGFVYMAHFDHATGQWSVVETIEPGQQGARIAPDTPFLINGRPARIIQRPT
jgi:hypothetical protein